jgi:hypothetical protein
VRIAVVAREDFLFAPPEVSLPILWDCQVAVYTTTTTTSFTEMSDTNGADPLGLFRSVSASMIRHVKDSKVFTLSDARCSLPTEAEVVLSARA